MDERYWLCPHGTSSTVEDGNFIHNDGKRCEFTYPDVAREEQVEFRRLLQWLPNGVHNVKVFANNYPSLDNLCTARPVHLYKVKGANMNCLAAWAAALTEIGRQQQISWLPALMMSNRFSDPYRDYRLRLSGMEHDMPDLSTSPCAGNCGNDDPHDAHLNSGNYPSLGVATTRQLLMELHARGNLDQNKMLIEHTLVLLRHLPIDVLNERTVD